MAWHHLAWLALAGAAGALSRLAVSGMVQKVCGDRFPFGALAVNVLGCFFFGLVWSLAEERLYLSAPTRFILLTGFLGAFTTFSTFAFETTLLLRDSQWALATLNIVVQNLLGLLFVLLGLAAARWI